MDKEYSFEDFFADGTGMEAPKTEESFLSSEGFDGYIDDINLNMYQAEEDIHFLNSFEAVSEMNTQMKINMLKKLKANYTHQSIESYCDNHIQSLELKDEKDETKKAGAIQVIKAKIVAVFKKICLFIQHLVTRIANMKYRGEAANNIKIHLHNNYLQAKDVIGLLSKLNTFNENQQKFLKLKQQLITQNNTMCLLVLKCYGLVYKIAKRENKKLKYADVIETNELEIVSPKLKEIRSILEDAGKYDKMLNSSKLRLIVNEDSIKRGVEEEMKTAEKIIKENDMRIEQLNKIKADLEKKLQTTPEKK